MSHPFDDKDLTFKDLKKIIERTFDGELDWEDGVTEKLDCQNLMESVSEKKIKKSEKKSWLYQLLFVRSRYERENDN